LDYIVFLTCLKHALLSARLNLKKGVIKFKKKQSLYRSSAYNMNTNKKDVSITFITNEKTFIYAPISIPSIHSLF